MKEKRKTCQNKRPAGSPMNLPWRVHVTAASRVVAMGLTAFPRVTPPQCQPASVTEALMHVRLATVLQVTITSTQVQFSWYHLLRKYKGKFSPSVLLEVALQSRRDFTLAEQTLVPIQHCLVPVAITIIYMPAARLGPRFKAYNPEIWNRVTWDECSPTSTLPSSGSIIHALSGRADTTSDVIKWLRSRQTQPSWWLFHPVMRCSHNCKYLKLSST